MTDQRPSHARRAAAALLLAILIIVPVLPGGGTALRTAEAGAPPTNWTYRDRVHKFSLKMFRDYERIPLKTDETTVVAKFGDPKNKGANRNSYPIQIEVIRVALKDQDKPVTTGKGEGENDDPRARLEELMGSFGKPKSVWEYMLNTLRGWRLDEKGKKVVEGFKDKSKKITSKDKPKIPGKLWQFNAPVVNPWDKEELHVTLAEFQKDGWAYGLVMTCGTRLEKHYAKGFKKIAKSFMWIDPKAEDVEQIDDLEGVNITAKKRLAIEKGMVSGWDVIVSSKKNYIVIYNTANGKNHFLAKVIADRIEKIREQIYEVQFPPAKPIDTVCIVRVCKDRQEYHKYGGPGGSAGYWSPGDEELVFYDASRSKKPDDDTLSVLYHEAFHQYIHYSVGEVAPHSWFNEGHGDYYAGAKYKGGKFRIEPFQWRVGTVKSAIVQGVRPCTEETDEQGNTRKVWEPKGYTPLKDLVRFTQGEYYSYPGVSYAQGWALIYFLREIVPKNKKYNEKWGHILTTYFDTLKAEVNKDGGLVPGGAKKDDDAEDEDEDEDDKDDDEKDDDAEDGDAPDPPDVGPPVAPPTGPGGEDDGEGDDEGEDGEPGFPAIPQTFFRGRGGPEALKKAVDKAFEGIDWEEFEAAWLKATKRGK